MNTYLFVLGLNHSLCKADIINILFANDIKINLLEASREVLILTTDKPLDIQTLILQLGSAVKIAEVFASFSYTTPESTILASLTSSPLLITNNQKLIFGVSTYHAGAKFKKLNEVYFFSNQVINAIKAQWKTKGKSAYLIPSKDRVISSVSVDKNKLLTDGFELLIAAGRESIYFAKTLAVQPYEDYSSRDYDRPARDDSAGMLPPKLAKILINLARQDKTATVLDPFCGSGTILSELALFGYTNILGSDMSSKSVNDSIKNIDWLFNNYRHINRKLLKLTIKQADVQSLSSAYDNTIVDTIITEPYLGSPQLLHMLLPKVEQEIVNLQKLYLATFTEFRKILRNKAVVVFIFPVIKYQKSFLQINLLPELQNLGFTPTLFTPDDYLTPEEVNLLAFETSPRKSILYYRPGQTVSREIFRFEFSK